MAEEWNDEELEAAVAVYLKMQDLDASNIKFSKLPFYRYLREILPHRTQESIEYRMLNISAVVDSLGGKFVNGLKPAKNVGTNVAARIKALLQKQMKINDVIRKAIKEAIKKTEDVFVSEKIESYKYEKTPLQIICFGAPGTGKSKYIDDITLACVNNDKECCIRTAFHPDTDYASFVGCYKPVANSEGKIQYKYVPQAFTKAYVKAWRNPHRDFFLIIEEINRGNCAQIFGDIFQLLDRNSSGMSSYDVKPDEDLQQYLKEAFQGAENQIDNIPIQIGDIMKLPANLHIYATMNTSDQSLFPIDSAFKRRWDWQYMPIVDEKRNHRIAVAGNEYDWWSFVEKINTRIEQVTESEDKQIGYWFAQVDENGIISADRFVSKVVSYLWNDVFKDYGQDGDSPFVLKSGEDTRVVRFRHFFLDTNKVDEVMTERFLRGLGMEPMQSESTAPVESSAQS